MTEIRFRKTPESVRIRGAILKFPRFTATCEDVYKNIYKSV